MKVAVVGGGGFRTPFVWEAVNEVAEAARVEEVALHDVSRSRLDLIARVIEGRRREVGGGPPVRTTTELPDAIEGAEVVFCAIRVGGLEGRVVDETVPLRHGVLGQETVGPGGISFALRTVPVMLDVAATVAQRAPRAWFLNFTNPAGLVTEALRPLLGDRVVGICDAPAALCARVASALGLRARDLDFGYAGLNHLGWLLGAHDGDGDLLPGLLESDALCRVEEARLLGVGRVRELGMVPNEYLVYYERPREVVDAFRRAGATRAELLVSQQACFYGAKREDDPVRALASWRRTRDARHATYMAEARAAPHLGPAEAEMAAAPDDEGPGELGYAAIAAAFLRAVASPGYETRLTLNVANRGRLGFLDDDAVVEVACDVGPHGPRARAARPLPRAQADLVARVKEVERTTIRAAVEGSRRLALEAVAAHPVVPSRAVAERIVDDYLAALPELAARLA